MHSPVFIMLYAALPGNQNDNLNRRTNQQKKKKTGRRATWLWHICDLPRGSTYPISDISLWTVSFSPVCRLHLTLKCEFPVSVRFWQLSLWRVSVGRNKEIRVILYSCVSVWVCGWWMYTWTSYGACHCVLFARASHYQTFFHFWWHAVALMFGSIFIFPTLICKHFLK